MEATPIPMTDPEIAIIIADSKVKHNLASSAYAERRRQCHEAAQLLGKSSLRDATEKEVEGINDFKYHVSGKISVTIKIAITFIFRFHSLPIQLVMLVPIGILLPL